MTDSSLKNAVRWYFLSSTLCALCIGTESNFRLKATVIAQYILIKILSKDLLKDYFENVNITL